MGRGQAAPAGWLQEADEETEGPGRGELSPVEAGQRAGVGEPLERPVGGSNLVSPAVGAFCEPLLFVVPVTPWGQTLEAPSPGGSSLHCSPHGLSFSPPVGF